MEFNKKGILERAKAAQQTTVVMDEGLRAYMLKVYNYMATGILLTGIIALISFKMSVVTDSSGAIAGFTSIGNALFFSGLKWIVMLAPLGVVFYMSFGINKMMGLIGIIIASLVNIFLKSSMMYFVISILGVLIFVGLTAYDTQKIKNMYVASDTGELMGKKAVMGALTLYLDFINLFIMLLRLFGQRR